MQDASKDSFDLPELPQPGSARPELRESAHRLWAEAAAKCGVDLSGFDPKSPFAARCAWAAAAGLEIAAAYLRYSTKMQGSSADQLRPIVEFGARNGMYCPPELICLDEAWKGRKEGRPGLQRLKEIFRLRLGTVLLLFKLSRLFRHMYKSVGFINEQIVSKGHRCIAITQSVDTADRRAWRLLVSIHGAMDENLLEAIADHVREGLVGLFLKGWTTGALPVGYCRKALPGAPPTRRGLARTVPAVEEAAAAMIREHFRLIADGMDLAEGWRKWRRDGGPVDPRCKTGRMGYYAYRRMLTRSDYIGVMEFCRTRNEWSSESDTLRQKPTPEAEVKLFRCEELRIVDDETFFRVQRRLAKLETGPRQRRDPAARVYHLWDLVTHLFRCANCKSADGHARRYHTCGARGQYMHCADPDCPARAMVHRREAVTALCRRLAELLGRDEALLDLVLASFAALPPRDRDELDAEIDRAERQVQYLGRKIRELEDLAGTGSEDDAKRRKEQVRATAAERSQAQLALARLKRQRGGGCRSDEPVTRERVAATLADLSGLFGAAATGELGKDVVGKAADLLERLVGGAVYVHAQRRPGRSRWQVRGRFTPDLLQAARVALGADEQSASADRKPADVELWLIEPPRVDEIADEVRHLYEVEIKGFRIIAQILKKKYGKPIGSGNCCAAYRRWYQVRGLPLPPRRTTMGRPRKQSD